jgi:hypothetical protein
LKHELEELSSLGTRSSTGIEDLMTRLDIEEERRYH